LDEEEAYTGEKEEEERYYRSNRCHRVYRQGSQGYRGYRGYSCTGPIDSLLHLETKVYTK
jgi:hypothetical protein